MHPYSGYVHAPCAACGRKSIACIRRGVGCQTVYCIKHGQHYTGWIRICIGHDPYCEYQFSYLWNAMRTAFRRWCRVTLRDTKIQATIDI